MDGAWISNNLPYGLVLAALGHGLLRNRSTQSKVLPARGAFFWRLLACCLLSVLLKYLFQGARPELAGCRAPPGWVVLRQRRLDDRLTGWVITRTPPCPFLAEQPTREIYQLPLSLANLKSRYGPTSGTPSSHSVLSGYLVKKSLSAPTRSLVLAGLSSLLGLSRIVYRCHYPYQVVLGAGCGFVFGLIG